MAEQSDLLYTVYIDGEKVDCESKTTSKGGATEKAVQDSTGAIVKYDVTINLSTVSLTLLMHKTTDLTKFHTKGKRYTIEIIYDNGKTDEFLNMNYTGESPSEDTERSIINFEGPPQAPSQAG